MLPSPQFADRARRALLVAALCAVAAFAADCGSTSTSVAGPTPPRCQVTLAGSASSFPSSGGTGTVTVTTDRDCTWTATPGASWISLSGSTNGQGDGTIGFSVAANSAVAPRGSNIAVNGQTFSISEQAAPCTFSVSPSVLSAPASGGTASISVQAQSGCAWTAATNATWISFSSGGAGNGTAAVQLAFAANSGPPRSATLTVAGQIVNVNQAGAGAGAPPPPPPSCAFSIAPTRLNFPSNGGNGAVAVTGAGTCDWTATSPVPWVTITTGASGTGNGQVTFAVDANTGPARSATLAIAGRTLTVGQSAGGGNPPPSCSFSISPTSQSFAAGGGNGTFAVQTSNGCSWTATSGASWVTIVAGASGAGNGAVFFSVAPNNGGARSTSITVGGQTFAVIEADGNAPPPPPPPPPPPACAFSIAPTTQSFGGTGGNGTVAVTTTAACSWTVTSGASWVTITSGSSGTGSGSVAFTVAPNTGPSRSTTLTIANQTFTVNQDPPACTYSVSPLNATATAAGGAGIVTFTVTTAAACAWTAASNAPWLTVDSGAAGTGPGTVIVSVAQNTGAARVGSLTVAGQPVTVSQDAAATGNVAGQIVNLTGACPTVNFAVDAVQVQTNSATAYARGSCRILDNGVGVAVSGFVQPDASLVATQVTIQKN